jgi:hypothetical protein
MHGAAGGAPKGSKNALKHGAYSAEAIAVGKQARDLARIARVGIEQIKDDPT